MKIGLIDVDSHNFPNLCLMKISAYHKSQGDEVEWWNEDSEYDIVYKAKVFSNDYTPDIPDPVNTMKIVRGGTGYAISKEGDREVFNQNLNENLPDEIEHIYPDYTIYPEYTHTDQPLKKQVAYGFLTRGCPRHCAFCHVGDKEGVKTQRVADLDEFWKGQGYVVCNDPNILASKDAVELLKRFKDENVKVEFNQGLDARLITPEIAELLASVKVQYPHFAMDTMESIESVRKGLALYKEAYQRIRGKWNYRLGRVFVLVNFNTTIQQDMERIKIIQDLDYRPCVMIYDKPSCLPIHRRLQRWSNNGFCYAGSNFDFMEYQKNTYKKVIEV